MTLPARYLSPHLQDDTQNFACDVEYLEIYNEKVCDLLSDPVKGAKKALKVREDPKRGPYVEGLSARTVHSFQEIDDLMELGNSHRTTAATAMNDTSSRSHAVFTLKFTQAQLIEGIPLEKTAKINLVDLAGSERTSSTGATGLRLKEGGNINKSLTTLGLVISALADRSKAEAKAEKKKKEAGEDASPGKGKKKKQLFVPYRDSVLTWLLKESLGGNSKTIMLAALSPADVNYGETLSTLHYANRAKSIVNKAVVNEDENVRIIKELRAEIMKLKDLLGGDAKIEQLAKDREDAMARLQNATTDEERAEIEAEIQELEEEEEAVASAPAMDAAALAQLQSAEAMMSNLTSAWQNKWQDQTRIMEDRALEVQEAGKSGMTITSEQPHLVSLNLDDPLATGITLYYIQHGMTLLGKAGTVNDMGSGPDICLNGDDACAMHAEITNEDDEHVELIPGEDSLCMVNGETVIEPTEIFQGNTIVLGRQNIFRFNHPKHASRLRLELSEGGGQSADGERSKLSTPSGSGVWSPTKIFNTTSEADREREKEELAETQRRLQEMEEAQAAREVEQEEAQAEKDRLEAEREKMVKDAAALSAKLQAMTDMVEAKDKAVADDTEEKAAEERRRQKEIDEMAQAKAKLEADQATAAAELEAMRLRNDALERERAERTAADDEATSALQMAEAEKEKLQAEKLKEVEETRQKMIDEHKALEEEHKRRQEEMEAKMKAAEDRIRKQEEEAAARLEAQLEEAKRVQMENERLSLEREAEKAARDVNENEAVKAKVEAEKALKQAEETAQQLKALKANNEAKEIERKAETVKRFEEEQQRRKQVAQLERKLKRAETMTVRRRDEVQSFDDIWNVKIPRFHIRDAEGGKPFVVFEVKVWLRGEEWKVFRRYSQFQQLHKGFKKQKALELVMKTISFPGKELFKSFGSKKTDPEFLKIRRQELERYIQEVIQKTHTSPASVFYRTNKKKVQRDSSFFNNAAAATLDLGPA